MKQYQLHLALLTLAITVLLTLAMLLPVHPSYAQCYATDGSEMIYRDNCGNTQYELAAMVDGGALDFYEEAEAFGTCYAGYYNCSNTWVNAGSYIGGEHIQQDYSTDYADYVYWELDDWIVEGYTSCNNGNSNDQQIVVVNDQSPTPDFAASCY